MLSVKTPAVTLPCGTPAWTSRSALSEEVASAAIMGSAAERKSHLPEEVLAALPEALAEVRRTQPDGRIKKGSVVHELQQLLASKHGRPVSKAKIARAVPADFASRD